MHIKNLDSTGSITGVDVTVTGSLTADKHYENAALNGGLIIDNIPAATAITGGMWVTGSAASGTTPTIVAIAGPASAEQPLGIALATVASGATVSILMRGFYNGVIADAALASPEGFAAGAGAALNTIKANAAGIARGQVVMAAAGSADTAAIYLF